MGGTHRVGAGRRDHAVRGGSRRAHRRILAADSLDERELAIPIMGDLGENGDPDALAGLGEVASRNGDARGIRRRAQRRRPRPRDAQARLGQRFGASGTTGRAVGPDITVILPGRTSGANVNVLTTARHTDMGESTAIHGTLVRVEALPEAAAVSADCSAPPR